MKQIITIFIIGMLTANISYSQAVDDRAVVPVSVTLNSILRLNVESGGNVEFNFNTLDQYRNGIPNSARYNTNISIASSVNWQLRMGAEDASLVTTDSVGGGGDMDLSYIGYQITSSGTGSNYTYSTGADAAVQPLEQIGVGADLIITDNGSGNAGSAEMNAFTINWECGTGFTGSPGSLLGSSLTGGRYSTNVFFILEPTP